MKYYAVTENPNELFHYGVKGMKWGQHIFGDKPKSPGYRRAINKLRVSIKTGAKSGAQRIKATAKKTAAQAAFNYRRAEQKHYENAVKRAQKRIQNAEFKANRYAFKKAALQKLQIAKEAKKAFKAEKHFDKYLQQAREGRLRYGKLTDEQVRRVTDRLNTEMAARRLGNVEKSRYRTRLKEAFKEGTIQGAMRGTASGMEAVAVAKIQNRLDRKRVLDTQSKQRAKRERAVNKIKNKKSHRELQKEFQREVYEEQLHEGKKGSVKTRLAAEAYKKLNSGKDASNANNNIRDAIYRRYVLGGKNDSTEDILARARNTDALKEIYSLKLPEPPKEPGKIKTIYTKTKKLAGRVHFTKPSKSAQKPMLYSMKSRSEAFGTTSGLTNSGKKRAAAIRKKRSRTRKIGTQVSFDKLFKGTK